MSPRGDGTLWSLKSSISQYMNVQDWFKSSISEYMNVQGPLEDFGKLLGDIWSCGHSRLPGPAYSACASDSSTSCQSIQTESNCGVWSLDGILCERESWNCSCYPAVSLNRKMTHGDGQRFKKSKLLWRMPLWGYSWMQTNLLIPLSSDPGVVQNKYSFLCDIRI